MKECIKTEVAVVFWVYWLEQEIFFFFFEGGGGGWGGVGWCRVSRFKVLSWWLVENEGIGWAESRDYEETDPVLDLLLTTSDGQQV